jgi:pimeloyl-ACP methyl ester carboxylesterase
MTRSLPTIVIVPGAWHSPAHFKQLSALFKQAGYPVSSSSLPSLNPSDPDTTTTTSDSTFIREQVLGPLLEKGTDILLVMHSYGGSPGSVAARGLSKVERMSGGLQGGVIGLVFIAALLAPEGASLLAMVGGKFHPWVQVNVCLSL